MKSVLIAISLSLALPATGIRQAPHDRAYWQSIVAAGFAVPAGTPAPALAGELSAMLGSPDPVLRDELAFSILSAWIGPKRVLAPGEIRPLMTEWIANLQRGVGSTSGPGVLLRSFSALMLSTVVARDNAEPFLSEAEFRALDAAARAYLAAERDLRGFDDTLGWVHATAHTADLLKFLGRSRYATRADQHNILQSIGARLQGAPIVFTFGEDERLARAVASLIIRSDFALDDFRGWVKAISTEPAGPTTSASLRSAQNVRNMLAKLGVLLARQPTLTPDAAAARDAVLMAVKF